MTDLIYDRAGELGRRDQVLRLRLYRQSRPPRVHAVLGWKGSPSARRGYRHRQELETVVANARVIRLMLERLRYRVTRAIDRRVEVYRLGGAALRLERYPRMDMLLEVEGRPTAIERAVQATGIPRAQFLSESLPYFARAYRRRTGRPARLSWARP
jgi:adenylate cyclase class IV